MKKNKSRFKQARIFGKTSSMDESTNSSNTLMKSPEWQNFSLQSGTTASSFNINNNGKHSHHKRLSGEFDGKGEPKVKGVTKTKKSTVESLPPTVGRASTQLRSEASGGSSKRTLSTASSDLDDYFQLPAQHPPPAVDYDARRSSAHRVSYKKAIKKAGYNMNDLGVSTATGSASPTPQRKATPQCLEELDWSESAVSNHHIWSPSNASGDLCYVGEQACLKSGPRKKCNACHIVLHESCHSLLDQINFPCKVTFREATSKSMRENLVVHHHWVHRRKLDGKCKQCGKLFEKRFGFREPTKVVAISCSWCKEAFHNKASCFQMHKINEPCSLGSFAKSIIPSTWIIRSSQKQKAARNRSKRKKGSTSTWRRKSAKDNTKPRPFFIRPLSQQTQFVSPTLVFINPKSGGKQGYKVMQQFQWFLNPRQIYDLSKGAPQEALELFRKVPNLRILACGGDGTVGWILSVLDKLNIPNAPPVAILPLGTGNDLSRTLNFGPGYIESDSIPKIIQGVEEAKMVKLDRWRLLVEKNKDAFSHADHEENVYEGVDKLPLNIVNNYFSIGFDAQVQLNFHNNREAHPDKFTSRIGNKMFYARASLLEYTTKEAKDLFRNTTLICDGVDYTSKIREIKPVCILFLNIPRYASGRIPWGNPTGGEFKAQCHDDKLIEVLAFRMHQLGMSLVGGHGDRICQCRSAHVKTYEPYPVQVDGEPCLLSPSNIKVEFFNQANMLYRIKRRSSVMTERQQSCDQLKIRVNVIESQQFDAYKRKKIPLCNSSAPLLVTVVMSQSTLDTVRSCLLLIMSEVERIKDSASEKWVFLDSSSSDKFYKIDKHKENLLTVSEITTKDKADREVYILHLTPSSTGPGIVETDSRSLLAPRPAVLRSHSDTTAMQGSNNYSNLFKSENKSDDFRFIGVGDEDLPDPTSSLLDVVFEQPEIAELETVGDDERMMSLHANVDVKAAGRPSTHAKSDQEQASVSLPTVSLNEATRQCDCSTSSGGALHEGSHPVAQPQKTPLRPSLSSPAVPPVQMLPLEFASQLSFEAANGKKEKKKGHRRSNSDGEPKKTAGFNFMPSQLIGFVTNNKNTSNNNNKNGAEKTSKKLANHTGLREKDDKVPPKAIRTNLKEKDTFLYSEQSYNNFSVDIQAIPEKAKKVLLEGCHLSNGGRARSCDKTFLQASKHGNLGLVTSSLREGANLCARDDAGFTALHHAVRYAHAQIVDYLLQQGETELLDMACVARGQTALHKAAWYGRVEMCEKLVQAGASLDGLDHKGMSAAARAKQGGHQKLVNFLSSIRESRGEKESDENTGL